MAGAYYFRNMPTKAGETTKHLNYINQFSDKISVSGPLEQNRMRGNHSTAPQTEHMRKQIPVSAFGM
jgi:hypothetical protein